MSYRAAGNWLLALATAVAAGGCTQTFDAGHNRPSGLLPVDQRNPIILLNDGAYDNWSGEYAILLANGGGSPLAGIIVDENSDWPDIQTNVGGYRDLVAAALAERAAEPAGSDRQHRRAAGHAGQRQDRGHAGEPLGGCAPDRRHLQQAGVALPAGGDRDRRRPDRRRRRLSRRSDGDRAGGGRLLAGERDQHGRRHGQTQRKQRPLGRLHRRLQVSLRPGQRLVRPADRRPHVQRSHAPQQRPRRLDRRQAAQPVAVVAGVGSGRGAGRRSSQLRDRNRARVSGPGAVDGGATAGPNLATDQSGSGWIVTGCDGMAATTRFWEILLGKIGP